MALLPHRTSLVTETVTILKRWITEGELNGVLPGEFRLKAKLGVGRDTLRLALKQLEQERWITTSGRGRQRRVQKQGRAELRTAAEHPLPVTFLSPFPMVDRIIHVELEELENQLAQERRELRFVSSTHLHSEHPDQFLKRVVSENPSAAWILHFVGGPAQSWFEQQSLPAFIYGTPFPDVHLPYVVNDWESAAFHAGLQLIRQGHRIIGQMAFEHSMPGMLAVERGLRRAIASNSDGAELTVFTDNHTPESVARSLSKAFSMEPRPTALVFCSSSQLLTCYSWMASKRLAVPQDVSLVCVPSDSWFAELYPPVCHYANNPRIIARYVRQKVLELVRTGRVARKSLRVRLEFQPGATIGPPPTEVISLPPPAQNSEA